VRLLAHKKSWKKKERKKKSSAMKKKNKKYSEADIKFSGKTTTDCT